ncbi:MAG: hypothetical protein M3R35_03385, partial [Candidatus Eremiobacteraeota bacterium]|nr:hypothetical protein [Candidatus Eremiobacteraeota bacterium]
RDGRLSARANDLSVGGLRLECYEDFLAGSKVTLDFHLPDEFVAAMTVEKELYEQSPFGLRPETVRVEQPRFAPMRIDAKILMTFFEPMTRKLAHGTEFLELDPKIEKELQRYLHLWQINYLRTRKDGN